MTKEFTHIVQLRSRYGETDQMGFVYYGRFAEYYEVGRVETMRALGMTYKELEETDHVLMPVMTMQVRYLRPAMYDQLLNVQTTIRQIPEDSITFFTEIKDEQNKLLNAATIKLCFLNAHTKKRIPCPLKIKEAIAHAFQSPDPR